MEVINNNYEDTICTLCDSAENDHSMLLCDTCDKGFHTYCMNLNKIPDGSWYCPKCVKMSEKPTEKSIFQGTRVHVYVRVSSTSQDQTEYGRVGLKVQNSALLEFCNKNDLIIVSTTVEVGSAYKKDKTSKLDTLINKVGKGEPILVYSCSRFSRNFEESSKKLNKLHNRWSYIWSITEDVKSRDDEFKNYIISAENESKMLSSRMVESHKRIKNLGGFTGRKKPFGYTIVRDENGIKILKENVIEQEIVKHIRDKYKSKSFKFNEFMKIISSEFNRYNWTIIGLKRVIDDYYSKECKIIKGDSFVKDMIQGLTSND
jgi:DNA invertase Pin-like site-specific DNA recombinase